jgi:hypothetical protein
MAQAPQRDPRLRICIVQRRDGVTLYGNRAAFRNLARWMEWLAEAPRGEHYECHVRWHLERQSERSASHVPRIWLLMDPELVDVCDRESEVTFMVTEKDELDRLLGYAASGVLPAELRDDGDE